MHLYKIQLGLSILFVMHPKQFRMRRYKNVLIDFIDIFFAAFFTLDTSCEHEKREKMI